LIENAFKHNIVRAEQPLNIVIATVGEEIIVQNNLQLKSSSEDSTKVGLKNISKQYIAAIGKDIEITKSKTTFEVKLPLI
jgi:LytS/YehU family sensor histidine kinase